MRHVDGIYARIIKHVLNDERRRQKQRRNHRRDVLFESKISRSYLEKIVIDLKEFFLCKRNGRHCAVSGKLLDIAHFAGESYKVLIDDSLGFHCVIVIKVLSDELLQNLIVMSGPALKVGKHS